MTKLEEFLAAEKAGRRYQANRMLCEWLADDDARQDLYRCLLDAKQALCFQSRADTKERLTDPGSSHFEQDVWLLARRDDVELALTDTDKFSNVPYQVLGSGTFMLGLDPQDGASPGHAAQRAFAQAFLGSLDDEAVAALASAALLAAAVLPLKQRNFDLVELAEQAALRFAGFLFGYEQADHALLERAMRLAYNGLNYQIVGRHFASDPAAIPEAGAGMGALLKRTAELLDLYRARVGRGQEETYERLELELAELRKFEEQYGKGPLMNFTPLLRRIAAQPAQGFSGTDLAVTVVGLIAGTIGNIQASAAIAINEFFKSAALRRKAVDLAKEARQGMAPSEEKLRYLIWEALRLNPPAAFLPRRTRKDVTLKDGQEIPKDTVVLLAMGAATRDLPPEQNPDGFEEDRNALDPLIFGGPEKGGRHLHQCLGQHLVTPAIVRIVRGVLALPGLERSWDPETGELLPLQKRWGIICERFPLEYNREEVLLQSPLIVIMKVRMPIAEHAEALKKVIHYGAPRIEKKLQDAGHVHFASFLFLEGDTKLALFTWYDRDFASYIEHFALQIGPLFDRIFEHIEDPPPMPVNKFPKEFVDTIRRHNTRPAGDYFFSAYPSVGVAKIVGQFPREKP